MPSHFVSSLRASSGRAVPLIPRPLVSEAARSSLNADTRVSRAASTAGHRAYVRRQPSGELMAPKQDVDVNDSDVGNAVVIESERAAQDAAEEEETDALTWPEFKRAVTSMIPTQKPRTDVHLRTWFDSLDPE